MPPIVQTQLFPPPTDSLAVDERKRFALPARQWLFTVQNLLPLVAVDTSTGNQVIALPPAGLNSSTGQSNQNMEMTFRKTTLDANTVTITGSADGPQVLTTGDNTPTSRVKFKSDGTVWWVTG